jgi:hypothetical protein
MGFDPGDWPVVTVRRVSCATAQGLTADGAADASDELAAIVLTHHHEADTQAIGRSEAWIPVIGTAAAVSQVRCWRPRCARPG